MIQPEDQLHPLGLSEPMRRIGYEWRTVQIFVLTQPIDDIESVSVRHTDIEHDHVRLESKAFVERTLAGMRNANGNIFSGEDFADDLAEVGVIFHNEEPRLLAGRAENFHEFFE